MVTHHAAFTALAPVEWAKVLSVPTKPEEPTTPEIRAQLQPFMIKTFQDAQVIVDSIPGAERPSLGGRPGSRRRSQSNSAIAATFRAHRDQDSPGTPAMSSGPQRPTHDPRLLAQLRSEWKEVKLNAASNPEHMSVYKLAAKDGKGSWFARRSVHDGLDFDRWRLALEREFSESLKVVGKPGDGNIRGIGADARVEQELCDGVGRLEVYQLSAQFPGPTTPREFITLLMMSDQHWEASRVGSPLRQFMIVSKPCTHPKCPNRQGYIRGQYESVEFIREIPNGSGKSFSKRARSSVDVRSGPLFDTDAGSEDRSRESDQFGGVSIEWVMVTRSDPGGSVPRFMVEKGTPNGIVTDASRFLQWAKAKQPESFDPIQEQAVRAKKASKDSFQLGTRPSVASEETPASHPVEPTSDLRRLVSSQHHVQQPSQSEQQATLAPISAADEPPIQSPGGLYSTLASAIGAAGSAVSSRLPMSLLWAPADESEAHGGVAAESMRSTLAAGMDNNDNDDSGSDSDSSVGSFESAVELNTHKDTHHHHRDMDVGNGTAATDRPPHSVGGHTRVNSSVSSSVTTDSTMRTSTMIPGSLGNSSVGDAKARQQHEKDVRKLQQRRAKLEDKLLRLRTRHADRDAAARERAEQEAARLEEKYRREVQRVEEKRAAEERKAQERAARHQERENRKALKLELDKVRTERDIALREAELLKQQVGQLQAQNTRLVARLGKMGVDTKELI